MIRPGKMRHAIRVQKVDFLPDASGREVETWVDVAELRAEVVSEGLADRPTDQAGSHGRLSVVLRVRNISGMVEGPNRILFRGRPFDLLAVVPVGDGRALDLTCEAPT